MEIVLRMNGMHTRFQAMEEGIIRVTHTCRDAFLPAESDCVVNKGRTEALLHETEDAWHFAAGKITVRMDKKTGALRFLNRQGETLLREPGRRPRVLEEIPVYRHVFDEARVQEGQSVDGARAWAEPSRTVKDRTAYACRQNFVFDGQEALYGLGSHEEGIGNLRGHSRLLYQHNMKAVVPVLVSTKGWGILFDMGGLLAFHDDEQGSYLWADCADELDYYFFYGDGSYASLMGKYRLLTGETPMLPRYALGYIQSKERYVDADEMLRVAGEYRRRNVPLDMLVLDWQSWPEGQWGWKTFDRERFPDPSAFIDALHDLQVRFMISIWPSMQGEKNLDRQEMLENGCMLGNRLIYNAFDEKARKLYWKQAEEHLFVHGVDAWWCDCTEPFECDWQGKIKPEPLMRAKGNTDEAKKYLDPAKINMYSLHHSRGIYEGQRGVTEEKRVCNLTRSSCAGQHRYATITWSGDVSANWETLKRHVPEGLNFCATGESYWSTDIGAFFPNGQWDPWFYEGDFDEGVADLGYRELYVRWAQYASVLPMMRSHGTGTPREIWQFGEKGTPFYDAIEKAIHLRYRLVPYLYSLMAAGNQNGMPMLRVPALVFPGDALLRQNQEQMMLGDQLLIKPVTRPMYYGPDSTPLEAESQQETVLLPQGHEWYCWHTGRRYQGGQTVVTHAPLDVLPMFVRAGAVLPWGAVAQSTVAQKDMPLEILVFPGADGEFSLYDDAGDGYSYEKGEAAWIPLRWDDEKRLLTIGERRGAYPGMAEKRTFLVRCFGGTAREAAYSGNEITVQLEVKQHQED